MLVTVDFNGAADEFGCAFTTGSVNILAEAVIGNIHLTKTCKDLLGAVVVIGGGAAGMMAAISASNNLNTVYLLEKNEKLGKKIYITGKGRCNLTNNCTKEDFIKNVVTNPRFLFSAINSFSPKETSFAIYVSLA